MKRDPRVRLADILSSIDNIREYTKDVSRADFEEDSLIQDAVLRRLEIIGEAVKGLPEPDRAREPQIPWRQIAGTRDKLIHDYYLVDLELVWEEPHNTLLLQSDRVLSGVRLRCATPDLIRLAPAAEWQIRYVAFSLDA